MTNRKIIVEFLGKDTSLGSATTDASRKTSKLGDTLKKVGKVGGLALAAGAVLAGKALYDMTKQAIDDQAAQAKLADALKKNADATDKQVASTEDWITAQGKALGVADDDLRPALGRLVTATHDVGKAQKLASLAMDVSAGTGKSLESVSTALMKAQNGQVSSLSRLGINTKNAAGKTITMEQATKRMADTFGGAATTHANTLQGKMQRLSLAFDEAKESIGARLIPVVTDLVTWFMDKAMPAIQDFGQSLAKDLGPILQKVIKWFRDDLMPALQKAGKEILPALKDAFAQVRKGLKSSQPFWEFLGKFIAKVLVPVLGKLIALVLPAIGRQIQLLGKFLGVSTKAFIALKDGAVTAAKWIRDKFNAIVDFFHNMPGRIRDAASGMWDGIKDAFRGAINYIIQAWNDLGFSIPGFDWPGPGSFPGVNISTPNIPTLDSGGIVRGPGVVRVGNIDEAMIPLSGRGAMTGALGGGPPIVIQVMLDGKVVEQSLIRRSRNTGRPIQVRALT